MSIYVAGFVRRRLVHPIAEVSWPLWKKTQIEMISIQPEVIYFRGAGGGFSLKLVPSEEAGRPDEDWMPFKKNQSRKLPPEYYAIQKETWRRLVKKYRTRSVGARRP